MKSSQYKDDLNQIRLTQDSQRALVERLSQPPIHTKPPYRLSRTAICVFTVCAALLTACAATVLQDTLRNYWGEESASLYDEYRQPLGQTATANGWKVTLTDAICDDYHAYIGLILEAPEDVTLEKTHTWPNPETGEIDHVATEYRFMDYDFDSVTREEIRLSWGPESLPDDDPTDNKLPFAFTINTMEKFNHDSYTISLSNLYHNSDWDNTPRRIEFGSMWMENGWFTEVLDEPGPWVFRNIRFDCPDSTKHYEINQTVPVLDGKATLTSIEVSPLSIRFSFAGGATYGIYDRDTIWNKSGLSTCMHPTKIYFTDGTIIDFTEYNTFRGEPLYFTHGGVGSNADDDEGIMECVITFDKLIDPATIDYITMDDIIITIPE